MAERESTVEMLVSSIFVNPDPQFWRGRRVALTGHTGFKGSWMALLLTRLGAQVYGYALAPNTEPNLYTSAQVAQQVDSQIDDIRDVDSLKSWLQRVNPEFVFHFAAQALVRQSYLDPVATMTSNFVGTLNLLEAARAQASIRSMVIVTTDKVYKNNETGRAYQENDSLGGHDPYSASKAACEILVSSYKQCFLQHIGVATARAGNVIGGGDWSADRLIPDAVRAWQQNQVLDIRRPDAIRPWQHVLEPLCGYLLLAQKLATQTGLNDAYNFGPDLADAVTVRTVIEHAQLAFGSGTSRFADQIEGPHEAGLLQLDNGLARRQLGVQARWHLSEAVTRSMHWYKSYLAGENADALCAADIEAYLNCEMA
nr:CDP-glucose 4,6-dehydratase [uncultured Undibacterium sp.]